MPDLHSSIHMLQSTPESQDLSMDGSAGANHVPRPNRIACESCRKRKLKCNSQRPSCANCARLGHECTYEQARKKSGPKRGYVKQLESRLGVKVCYVASGYELLTFIFVQSANRNAAAQSKAKWQNASRGERRESLISSTNDKYISVIA